MMLSDKDIIAAINSGSLEINPFTEKAVRPSGITLHLGKTLLRPLPGTVVDVKGGDVPKYDEITLTIDKPYRLEHGDFVLGHTFESVTVGSQLGFFIEGRSTLARVGLTIVQTAMLVYPGHRDRTVTLEITNHGPNPILLYPEMKIARVALIELKSPCGELYDDTGKYREQTVVGPPIFENEFRHVESKK